MPLLFVLLMVLLGYAVNSDGFAAGWEFMLVSFAAITSAISISEPALAYLVEQYNAKRSRVAISLGVIAWTLGIGSVLSFNHWADLHIVGELNFFDFVDYVSQNIMLPLGGLLISLFAAWGLPKTVIGSQLGLSRPGVLIVWKLLCGVVAPIGVLSVFAVSIGLDQVVYRLLGGAT